MSEIEFFFDVASPYSYLASTQMDALEARTGAKVRWRPFLLGGVFKATENIPPASVPQRASYLLRDLDRWAAHYQVPFNFPAAFPINSLGAQRALTAALKAGGEEKVRALAKALFHAYWVDGKDISSGDELSFLINEAGLSAKEIGAAMGSTEVKTALREATDEATRRGAFGAPTFFIGDAMFFGNDRLFMVEAQVSGGEG